jgi:hypothetical protein
MIRRLMGCWLTDGSVILLVFCPQDKFLSLFRLTRPFTML